MKKSLYLLLLLLVIGNSFNYSSASVIVPVASSEPDPTAVKKATAEFNNLSRREKKMRIKAVKKEVNKFNAEKKAGKEPSTNTLLLVILAILLPPLAVYLYEGSITSHFWIALVLTLLFWLPGIIYALIIILGNK